MTNRTRDGVERMLQQNTENLHQRIDSLDRRLILFCRSAAQGDEDQKKDLDSQIKLIHDYLGVEQKDIPPARKLVRRK